NLISHNSVNVTGLAEGFTPIANQQQRLPYVGKNSTSADLGTTTTPSTSGGNTTSSFVRSGITSPNNSSSKSSSNPLHIMSVSIHVTKSGHPGDKQTIAVKVSDKNSTTPIANASVFGTITEPSGGIFRKFDGTTDGTGKATYS